MRSLSLLGPLLVCVAVGTPAHAQGVRFPGDSPTRPAAMGGKVLGTPDTKRPRVRTFTINQGGFRYPGRWYAGYPGYNYFWEGSPRGYYYPTYYPYPAVRTVDYRVLYGLDVPGTVQAPVNNRPINPPAPAAQLPPGPDLPDPAVAAQLKRAWRYIDLGDRYLREGRLLDARNRYRKAESAAPDLAAVAFRQMFLELAHGNLETAAAHLQRGLLLDPDWPTRRFALPTVYSDKTLRQVTQSLDQRLRQFPNDADALVLSGVIAYSHGDQALAERQFQRALRVTNGQSVAQWFFADPEPEPQETLP